ncbi:hypothetical protein CSZ94_11720 [Janthinobacterium sp. ROICE36]|uniref:hypothetical protein n=1 Tax=Janthinobacterium sp. ROICE36 TaxID=2048670 RepID=UPI000C7F0357|nr:hypothetical protein [Janthinobacterium sp. ROICE36]PLY42162.1 hypothetical protein CSZ94_11720 [Janthinobacterium sp. ROICE36]
MACLASLQALGATLAMLAGAAGAGEPVQRVLTPIDWPAAGQAHADAALRPLRATAPAGLAQVRIPVLLLPAEGDWGAPRFHGQGTAYAALYAPAGAKLGLFGSATHLLAPSDLKLEHAGGAFESIGDGADYSFTRFGAAYTLRMSCDEPLKDKRCTDPQYLTDAARALLLVAGEKP